MEQHQLRPRRFCLVLIKPSHYDDDGYVIQWLRSPIPSNSLAAVNGLAADCARRKVLGDDVTIDIHAVDETNTRVRPERLAALIEAAGAGLVMLVGVQSNQFPRALDLARRFRDRGLMVAVGGFHVSGVISMLDGADAGLDRARAMGLSLFAGEAEEHFAEVLQDAYAGRLRPLYNFMHDLPGLAGASVPILPAATVRRTAGSITSFDAGRGCPYQCSFCTIINVQGRKSRRRTPDDVEAAVLANLAQGLHRFFITDDNFARNKDWEPIIDRLIELRQRDGLRFSIIIQVDTLCHKIPGFVEKCVRAGVRRVFIGLENINPDSLMGAKKKQNKITEYRKMLLAWKAHGVTTYAGYILGFPNDTPESIVRDIKIIQKELPVDILEFFYLTPLPGSEDHQKLVRAGVETDPDLNKYDLNHVTVGHAGMSPAEWERAYRLAWDTYFSREHLETVIRRAAATRTNLGNIIFFLAWFKGSIGIEKIHPLEVGIFRRKVRRDRRPTLPIEPPWVFYPKYAVETAVKQARWLSLYLRLELFRQRVRRNPQRFAYTDTALTPVAEDEADTLGLFQSEGARAYIGQERRLAEARHGASAA